MRKFEFLRAGTAKRSIPGREGKGRRQGGRAIEHMARNFERLFSPPLYSSWLEIRGLRKCRSSFLLETFNPRCWGSCQRLLRFLSYLKERMDLKEDALEKLSLSFPLSILLLLVHKRSSLKKLQKNLIGKKLKLWSLVDKIDSFLHSFCLIC